jgi:hypothetical protein
MRIRFYKETHVGICRIQLVYPRHGDVFYLRALLLYRSALDWIDIRTVDGVIYSTHQEAARALGLFDNSEESVMAFEEMLKFGAAPAQLRWTFAVLAAEGHPVMAIWEAHEGSLSADILDRVLRMTATPDPTLVRHELLRTLQIILRGLGRSLTDIGLPEPQQSELEVDAERLRWGGDPTNLCAFTDSLTAEQVRTISWILIYLLKVTPNNSARVLRPDHANFEYG